MLFKDVFNVLQEDRKQRVLRKTECLNAVDYAVVTVTLVSFVILGLSATKE